MKRVAIFVAGSESDRDCLVAARALADLTGAHLDVVYPHLGRTTLMLDVAPPHPRHVDVGAVDRDIARRTYNEVCGDATNARWFAIEGAMDDAIRALGLGYDLTIIERLSEERGAQAKALNTALFEIGSPVLVTPPEAPATLGRVAAMIWNGTRQSARAMRSAMPLLCACERICLFTNSEHPQANPDGAVEYLGYHQILPEVMSYEGSGLTARGRGRAIIQAAKSVEADLIVMGAFGDNHFDVLMGLGRTTRKLATAAPVPLLLQS